MKKIITTLLFIAFYNVIWAQPEPKITEQIRQMSRGNFSALVMEFPGKASSLKSVRQDWEDFVDNYKGKTSYDKNADEVFSDNATIKDMSENAVDIYAKVVMKDDKTMELVVWYNLGVNYLSSSEYAQGMPAATAMLKEFSKKIFLNLLKEQLSDKEKELKGQQSALKSMLKEAAGFDKTIKKYEEQIKEIEAKIKGVKEKEALNIEEQAKQKATIDNQQKQIEDLKREIDSMKSRKRR